MTNASFYHIGPAKAQEYDGLKALFTDTAKGYRDLCPDRYRVVGQILPPRWQFNLMVGLKKFGMLQNLAMLTANAGMPYTPIGAVYLESVANSDRSWTKFPKTAVIETMVIDERARTPELEDRLVRAAIEWARKTGHKNIEVKDIPEQAANMAAYQRAGMKTDYIVSGLRL